GGIVSHFGGLSSSDEVAIGPPTFKNRVMKRAWTANSTATTLVPSAPGEIGLLAPPPKFKLTSKMDDVEVRMITASAKIAEERDRKGMTTSRVVNRARQEPMASSSPTTSNPNRRISSTSQASQLTLFKEYYRYYIPDVGGPMMGYGSSLPEAGEFESTGQPHSPRR
ncbi:hypothetical protein FS837_005898, partial [Tulasnella sp. UAMH 9824]